MYTEFSNTDTGRNAVSKEQVSSGRAWRGGGGYSHIYLLWACAAVKGFGFQAGKSGIGYRNQTVLV